jgi:hypothetical protein
MELSAMLPVVLLIGVGVIELSNLFFNYQLVQNGVRDAARYGASLPFAKDSTELGIQNGWIRNMAVTGQPTGGTSRLQGWTTAQVTITRQTIANPLLTGGLRSYRADGGVQVLTVSARVPYPSLGFLGFLGAESALTLTASQQERVLGSR